MRSLITLIALSSTGCIIVKDDDPDPDPDTDPIVVECDEDGDGFEGTQCDGDDCDDEDGDVFPGADEIYGDEADQDCDGNLDARLDTFDAPARTESWDWGWAPDLRSLGGVVITGSGQLAAQEIILDDAFAGGVIGKTRTVYGEPGTLTGTSRTRDAEGTLDVVGEVEGLAVFRPAGDNRVDPLWSGAWGDGHMAAEVVDGVVWAVRCDGTHVEAVGINLYTDAEPLRHTMPHEGTTCAVLGGAQPTVLVAGAGDLERWHLVPEVGFDNRLRLASDVVPEVLQTATAGPEGVMALLDQGNIMVFDRSGEGAVLGNGIATSAFDVSVDEDGRLLVAWVDQDGVLWAADGSLPETPVSVALADGVSADAVYVGLREGELAVAAMDGSTLLLARARR